MSGVKITVKLCVKLITNERSWSLLEGNGIGAETPLAPRVREACI